MVKDCMHPFQKSAVQRFHHSIVLRGVMHCKATLGTLQLQEMCKFTAGVLTTVVRPKSFDVGTVLCLSPCCKSLVSLQGLIFGL